MERSLEFVENREPRGCFGADAEALTGENQDDIHRALAVAELYHPDMGVSIASDLDYSEAMSKAGIKVRFEEIMPHYDPFNGNKEPLDDSEIAVETRLEILRKTLHGDDHRGAIIAFPCQRYEDTDTFLHFIAAIAPQETAAELTIMDPSELFHRDTDERIGGVFHKTTQEVREMLTPLPEKFLPVCAWLVQVDELPEPKISPVAEAEASPDTELSRALITSGVTRPFIF